MRTFRIGLLQKDIFAQNFQYHLSNLYQVKQYSKWRSSKQNLSRDIKVSILTGGIACNQNILTVLLLPGEDMLFFKYGFPRCLATDFN